MSEEKPFDISVSDGTPRRVVVRGVLDERVIFSPYLANERDTSIIIDGSAIRRMTSFSVGRWLRWMDAITERGNRVFFFRANPVMCAQLFHVARFLPERGALLSIVAPYRCSGCNAEGELELWVDEAEKHASFPTMPCLKCGGAMTLDHDAEDLRVLLKPFFGRPVPEDVRAAVGR